MSLMEVSTIYEKHSFLLTDEKIPVTHNEMCLVEVSTIYEKYSFLLTDEKIPVKHDIFLNDLGCLTMNFDDFLTSQSDALYNRNSIVPRLAELIVSFGLIKTFDGAEDRDFDAKDFPTEARDAAECFQYLNCLMEQYENIDTAGKRKFLVQVILLCATHSSTYLWSSKESLSSSQKFLENLIRRSGHNSLSNLLCDETFYPTIFKAVLKWIRPMLMKDTWSKNPSSPYIFYWLLSHMKHPHLVEYFNDVMPPPFMFTNYYAVPQQVIGIKCFDHILDNVPPSLIKSNGVEEVIFDSLKKYIYSKDIAVIEVLYPCLLKLPMMNLQKANHLEWLEFDDVIQQLLVNIDMECDPKIRHAFLTQMSLFIQSTPCFKHLKKSLCVLLQNFTANSLAEEKCRAASLKVIKELIRSCWPRMENHCYDIMSAILKSLYDIENPSYVPENILSEEVYSLCKECLALLKYLCPKTFNSLANEYIEGDVPLPGVSLLQSI